MWKPPLSPPSPPPFPAGFKWHFCETQSEVSLINETILAAYGNEMFHNSRYSDYSFSRTAFQVNIMSSHLPLQFLAINLKLKTKNIKTIISVFFLLLFSSDTGLINHYGSLSSEFNKKLKYC